MSTLGNIVAKTAPILGSVLNLALPGSGLVLSGLMSLFNIRSNSEDDLANTIANDPNAAEKLAEFEITHKYDLEQIQAADVANARSREVEVTKATQKQDKTVSTLAFVFVGGFFVYSFLLFFVHIDPTVHDIVLLLAGQISALAFSVGSYYFGGMFKSKTSPLPTKPDLVLPPPAQTR